MQKFPVLYPGERDFVVSGRHVDEDARIFVDGHRVEGEILHKKKERIAIKLNQRPENGMHLLQLQNPGGQFSNDFILTSAQTRPVQESDDDKKVKTLGEVLKLSRWDRLIGTWVDKETKGKGLKLKFNWKIKDRVIEAESIDPTRHTVSLISVNAGNGDVFQTGADSKGSSHLGTWNFHKNGKAVLDLGYTDENGERGQIVLRYELLDDDTLDFTLATASPINVLLVRSEE